MRSVLNVFLFLFFCACAFNFMCFLHCLTSYVILSSKEVAKFSLKLSFQWLFTKKFLETVQSFKQNK